MKLCNYIFSIATFLGFSITADPMITFFMRSYPDIQRINDKLKKPGRIARNTLEGLARYNGVSGIFASYAGYVQVSNLNGQVMFPRKHTKPLIYLVITNKITPIPMFENTIHHWELDPLTTAQMYELELKQDNQTELFFWDMKPVDLPADQIIPLESIIIIAKPKNIYIPLGITVTKPQGTNLVLPDLYVKKCINIMKNALYMLNIMHFMGETRILYKQTPIQESLLIGN